MSDESISFGVSDEPYEEDAEGPGSAADEPITPTPPDTPAQPQVEESEQSDQGGT